MSTTADTPAAPATKRDSETNLADIGKKDYVDDDGTRVMARTRTLRFICCVCKLQFKKKFPCMKHLAVAHNIQVKEIRLYQPEPEEDGFNCRHCPKQFTSRSNLHRHMRSFHPHKSRSLMPIKKRTEACPMCPMNFTTVSGVNRHIRLKHLTYLEDADETASNSVSCHFCDLKFPHERGCSDHMANFHHALLITNMREGGKITSSYKCCLCNQEIYQQSDLKEHLLTEHEVKLREFCVEITSDTEEGTGSGSTFNCDGCHMSFISEQVWRSHMKDEHSAFPESCCHKCGDSSQKTIADLKHHLKDVHFIVSPDKGSKKAGAVPKRKLKEILNLGDGELNALEKIPDWLVKHGEGQLLVVVQR